MAQDWEMSHRITERVANSAWASPLVFITKADSTARFCDYRVTVNVIESDINTLSTTEGLFVTIAGFKTFSKINLFSSHLQLELHVRSQ